MLRTAEIDHFRTFGFVVLRGFLATYTGVLQAEVDAAIRDAYGARYTERVVDGISGHYLPMASRLTPVSASLICDDDRLMDAAEDLLRGEVLPECPEGVLYFYEAGWHDDDGIGVHGVKFATYFDALSACNGALCFLPGSHHPDYGDRLDGFLRKRRTFDSDADPSERKRLVPSYVADTLPGDVLAFDLHTWHASFGGRDRLAWTIVFQRRPESDEQREKSLRSMHDSFGQSFRDFDRDRYPMWLDWIGGLASHPGRAKVLGRLRADGVLDVPGAEVGW